MIDIQKEKESSLTTQQVYDVIDFAVQAAEDNGFVNLFVLERALYVYMAIVLFPARKDDITALAAKNILEAWQELLNDGTIDRLYDDYNADMAWLAEEAYTWSNDFSEYLHSARGLLNSFQEVSGDILANAARTLSQSVNESEVKEVLQIADEWGMNREIAKPAPDTTPLVDADSLFAE